MPPHFAGPMSTIGTELLYSFIIIAISLIIYFSTREIEILSSYKGIKYFRKSFLFFALAFFFKVFIQFLVRSFGVRRASEFAPSSLGFISLFLFVFFSTLAIFYLIYSLVWRKLNSKSISLIYFLSLLVAFIVILTQDILVYLGINILLFIFLTSIVLISHKNSKQGNNLIAIYILLLLFLIFNIIDILIPNFLQTFQLLIYFISCGIFLAILYKVLRKLGT
jgi:hypothetical protein